MKKLTIILIAVTAVIGAGVIACNSSSAPSKNREGITEISGPAGEKATADTTKQFSPI